jgi:hypothetical protein
LEPEWVHAVTTMKTAANDSFEAADRIALSFGGAFEV